MALRSALSSYVITGIIVAVLLLLASFVAYELSKRPRDFSAIYASTMTQLVKRGLLSRVHPWHEANSSEIAAQAPALRQSLAKFMDLYMRGRFGGDTAVSRQA